MLTILVRVSNGELNGELHKGSCQAVHCPREQTENVVVVVVVVVAVVVVVVVVVYVKGICKRLLCK